MILQIRGTSGTGKTTLVRALMEHAGCKPHNRVERKRGVSVTAYKGMWDGGHVGMPFYVLGSYESAGSGGCDRIRTIDEVIELVDKYAGPSHRKNGKHTAIVVFEGLLLSHSWGAMGEHVHEKYGHRYVNAFLDTTEKQAIKNVLKRRRDNSNPERIEKIIGNINADYHRVELCYNRVIARGGYRIDVPYRKSIEFTKDYIDNWIDTTFI